MTMLRCPQNLCNATYTNDREGREASAKHAKHGFSFVQSIRLLDINPARGFDVRGVRYILKKWGA